MTKLLFKTLAVLAILAGGIMVVVDAFGTGTANQYIFNFFFFTLVLPSCIALWFKADGQFDGITQ